MALVFGLRASEITGLQVKNLDADGTIIRITTAKSRAGIRSLAVPTWFKPFLAELADGKQPGDLLVGHDRTWLHRSVRAICKQAGVTEAPPHGLRGTHGDLALVGAATPAAVSRALGHESQEVTFRHYADRVWRTSSSTCRPWKRWSPPHQLAQNPAFRVTQELPRQLPTPGSRKNTRPQKQKPQNIRGSWCGRGDLNSHSISTTRT